MSRPPEPLSAQPASYFLTRAAEFRAMAMAARDMASVAALIRLADRFDALAAKRLDPPDEDGSA